MTSDLPQGDPLELLTAKETAQLIRRSYRSMERDRTNGGGIPFLKIGDRVFYRRCDVEQWLESRVFQSTAEYQDAQAAA